MDNASYSRLLFLLISLALCAPTARAQSVDIPTLPGNSTKPLIVTYEVSVNADIAEETSQVDASATVTGTGFSYSPVIAMTAVTVLGFTIQSPVYFLWNGFLSMQNVVGLLNRDGIPLGVTAKLLNQDGQQLSSTSLVIPASGEVDLAVNLLPGFQQMALGVLRLEFERNQFDGNGFLYRFARDQQTLEFMTGGAFENSIRGDSFVSFNTIQPSRNPAQLTNEITNWLSIVNTEEQTAASFTVELYSQTGALLKSSVLTIPPLGRRDLAAGHDNPGKNNVGLIRISPADGELGYLASLVRYGASGPVTALAKFFHFALYLPARQASHSTEWAPLSRGAGGENWVVLSNASNTQGTYRLRFYSQTGALLQTLDLNIPPHGQLHAFANGLLPEGGSGLVEIEPLTANGFVSESTFYFYDARNAELTAAYATPSRRPLGTDLFGSYNTFLKQFDFVKVFNVSGSSNSQVFSLAKDNGSFSGSSGFQLLSKQGSEFAVHELPYKPGSNAYGALGLSTNVAGSALAEVLRIQFSSDGQRVEAAQSLPIRGATSSLTSNASDRRLPNQHRAE